MNLTNEGAQEINRRVAVAMGWVPATRQDGTVWSKAWWVIGDVTKCPPHQNFCRDAAAADLVRQEIERRGWMLTRVDYKSERPLPAYPSQHRAQILTGHQKYGDDGIWGASDDSPCVALCLAFLAAHEATATE